MKNHLVLQIAVINTCFAAVLAWAYMAGYVMTALDADTSGISYVIITLFAFGLVSSWIRAAKVGALFDQFKVTNSGAGRWSIRRRAAKMPAKNFHLTEIAKWLAMLGMFGTVVGLITMAFSLKGALGSADGLTEAVAMAFEGYGVALVTTAVGIVAGAWIETNALLIGTATACLIEDAKGDR